jgi:uncharacterized membrane protein YheB (UPF0754 family)
MAKKKKLPKKKSTDPTLDWINQLLSSEAGQQILQEVVMKRVDSALDRHLEDALLIVLNSDKQIRKTIHHLVKERIDKVLPKMIDDLVRALYFGVD